MTETLRPARVGPGPRQGFRWNRETIVYAIDLWHRRTLQSPTQDDWERAGPDHPCRLTVIRAFGSWNAAVSAAGLRPRAQGENREWARRRCPEDGRWCTCEPDRLAASCATRGAGRAPATIASG